MPIVSEQVRAGTTAEWADTDPSDGAAAPVLGAGEIGFDRSTGQIGVGDGTTAFPSLALKHRPYRVVAVTLVGGTKVVADTGITANSIVIPVLKTLGTISTSASYVCSARTAGTSFTILSSAGTDTSTLQVLIIEP